TELELTAAGAEPRATAALAGLIAAREGDTRTSLRQLKRAFPALGTTLQGSAPPAALELYYPLAYRAAIARAAAEQGLSAALVFGMVHQESGFDAAARSRSGARGLMQLMPATGREIAGKLGVPFSSARLDEPDYSLRLGTGYFRRVLGMFDGSQELALAAYNGGPGRISRLWRAAGPAPELDRFLEGLALEESRNYVKRILVLAESYRSLYPDLG
ncbi:MAG: lytic transglycosylase domain-containing protein, partial [Thermoanaerobaculia bacterium]